MKERRQTRDGVRQGQSLVDASLCQGREAFAAVRLWPDGVAPGGSGRWSRFRSAGVNGPGYNLPILENRPDATQDIRLVRARDQTGYAETFPPK